MTRFFNPNRKLARLVLCAMVAIVGTASGCAGVLVGLSWMMGGDMIPPRSKALQGKRVAVVVVSDTSTYGRTGEAAMLNLNLNQMLRRNVRSVSMISPDRIADWRDKTDDFSPDFKKLGKSVKADVVLVVQMEGFSTESGKTLRKGKVDWGVTVYDVRGGEIAYRDKDTFQFPQNGYHITDSTPFQFRKEFVKRLAVTIARHFHSYSKYDALGLDPPGI